jgi:hypothetical protein
MKIQIIFNNIRITGNEGPGWVELPGNIAFGTSLSQYIEYLMSSHQEEILPAQCIKVLLWILGEK